MLRAGVQPSTFAIAKADMMIRGGDPNNMRFGDTLSEDQFPGFTFQYIISNPPFGIDWKREQKAVEAEAARGEMGRFAPGLPKISDGQQLFVLNGLAKLANKGKMAIIQNGSPLFSGDAGSGPSNIRQVYSGKRLAGLHHPAFHRYVHEHRHLHLHLGAQQG